ncbi:MAG: hypothetical protein HYY28_01685 [Betaproteobacteria bacterium]|nr:hypothetical protein [Betaproteobacteria bacterium]MBI2958999.1 hypothetical protein [Betaproteobacteria bacterium]
MTTTPELSALQDLCTRLDGAGIAYMLTGSLAMSHYARPRMTRDIDLVVALEASAVHTLTGALGEDYYADKQAIEEGFRLLRPCNLIHLPTVVKIDLIPRKESEYRRLEFERRRKVDFAGVELWIASREDLILSKLEWARASRSELQMRDVRQLLDGALDRDYLDSWARRLDLDALLKEASDE